MHQVFVNKNIKHNNENGQQNLVLNFYTIILKLKKYEQNVE